MNDKKTMKNAGFAFLHKAWYTEKEKSANPAGKRRNGNMKTKFGIVGCGFLGNIVADAWKKAISLAKSTADSTSLTTREGITG